MFFVKTKYATAHIGDKTYPLLRHQRIKPIPWVEPVEVTMEPIALTLGQQFDIEQRSRDISAITDVKQLQKISKDLLLAWQEEIARSRAAASPHLK